jgi:hypothetical protein
MSNEFRKWVDSQQPGNCLARVEPRTDTADALDSLNALPCASSMLIPPGANLANQVCAGTGAPPGSDTINGADYLAMAFGKFGANLPSESTPSPALKASWKV